MPRILAKGSHSPGLGATHSEGEQVAALLQVTPFMESDALDHLVKIQRSPSILHLATHGFFLSDAKQASTPDLIGPSRAKSYPGNRLELLARVPNPLLRSGLALAGVNTWLQECDDALPPKAEDGLLTAFDVAGLDLLDTDLVVLSACETGLGTIQVGEGVFGLRRAFMLAGAKTLVMSLWKVPDQATQELMVDFYQRLLTGAPRAQALREAQLALRSVYPDPCYWGAFICQGEYGPLAWSTNERTL
jgi:CHAT domain-containing protein